MSSILAEEWNIAPLEICQYVMSFIEIMPLVRKEFVLSCDATEIELLDKDTCVVGGQSMCEVCGDGHQLPAPANKLGDVCVYDGKIYTYIKNDKRTLYIVGKNKTTKIEVNSDITCIVKRMDGTIAVHAGYEILLCTDPVTSFVTAYNGCVWTDGDTVYQIPWTVAVILDNTIAYITTKNIDGVPQKIAVIADL